MTIASKIALCTLIVAVHVATAKTILLTFDQLGTIPSTEPILNYYAGGFAGNGTANCGFSVCGRGPNYGISFEGNALVVTSKDQGGGGNFNGEPSPANVVFFLTGSGDIMNVAGGFMTGFSFYYSAANVPGAISVWSGPDATGTLLSTLNLPVTPSGGGSCDQHFCPWIPIGVSFSGIADSVNFSGSANQIGFDNITLGSSSPMTSTPEPSTLVLFTAGFLGLASISRLGLRLNRQGLNRESGRNPCRQ